MVKHLVFWKLKEEHEGKDKNALAHELKSKLLALQPKISALKNIEVGINDIHPEKNHDVALITDFENYDDLNTYANHPEHLALVDFVRSITTQRAAVDYTY